MKRAIIFVLLFGIEQALVCQNMVVNPEFELWSNATKPTDWSNSQYCLKDSDNVKSGIYSCRQDGGTSSRDLGQKFIVSPDKLYRFSFFYKSGAATTGNGCRVWCEWLDENKISLDDPSTESVLHSGFLKSEEWKQFSADITSPAGAGYFYLLVRTLPNSITFWDDFIFEENVTTFEHEATHQEITIYPNPARNYLIICNIQHLQHIDIQNIAGASVWSSGFSGEEVISIPVSGLSEGLYIIRIRTSERFIIRKFIRKAD